MMPLLVRVDNLDTQTSTQYAYTRSPVRIGRNPLNDLALDSAFASQWHGVVQFNDTATQFFDLGSTNGTLVNGQRVGKNVPVPLETNTELRLGQLRIYFARGPAPPHLLADKRSATGGFGGGAGGAQPELGSDFEGGGAGEATVVFNADAGPGYNMKGGGTAHLPGGGMGASVAQLRGVVSTLRPLYDNYRRAWQQLYQGINDAMRVMPPATQKLAITFFERELTGITGEDQFRQLAGSLQVPLTGPAGAALAAGQLVTQLAQYFVPKQKPPETATEVQRLLVRIASVLETYSSSYVQLRKGYNQFGAEMLPYGRAQSDVSPVTAASDPKEILGYLLDWNVDGDARVGELSSAYADIMIHQVALLNGLMEGVRSLLQRLGPAEIERTSSNGLLSKIWPFSAATRWAQFVKRHREFTEEDKEITATVFGKEFARAYSGVTGENFTAGASKQLNDSNRR